MHACMASGHTMCMCVCVCAYVRMYVRVYACMYVCMCVCVYVCVYVCMYVCMYVCTWGVSFSYGQCPRSKALLCKLTGSVPLLGMGI